MKLSDLFKSKADRSAPPAGMLWTGPAAYTMDYSIVDKPGFYALTEDGKEFRRPLVRLVMVDDAPGNDEDGSCHLEVASSSDPAQMHRGLRVVSLSTEVEGTSDVAAGGTDHAA